MKLETGALLFYVMFLPCVMDLINQRRPDTDFLPAPPATDWRPPDMPEARPDFLAPPLLLMLLTFGGVSPELSKLREKWEILEISSFQNEKS